MRRQGLPELLKSFPTMGVAREWADVREGEIVKREFVNYREANRHTLANVLTTTRSISSRWTRTALIEAASARSARTASAPSACLCSSRPTWQRAYFSDRGRPFQPDRGRRNGAVGDALGERTSSVLNVVQSSTIRLKRLVVGA